MHVDSLVTCNVSPKFCSKTTCKYSIICLTRYANFGWPLEKNPYSKDLMLIIEVNFEYRCKIYAWRRNILNTFKNLIKIDCPSAVYGECITSQEYDVPDLYNNTIYMYIWCLTPLIYTDFFISWRLLSSLFGSEVRRLPD